MCTTDPQTCRVHSTTVSRVRWSFVQDEIQLGELENGLNNRGLREAELLQAIQNDRERLENVISQTPANVLNPSIEVKVDDDQKLTRYECR